MPTNQGNKDIVPSSPLPSFTKEHLETIDLDDIQRNIEEEKEQRIADLQARAKPKEELIISIDCLVEKVKGTLRATSFTPVSEIYLGGHTPIYAGGDQAQTELTVSTGTPVKTIYFRGWPPLEAGDHITAYIFKGQEKSEDPHYFPHPSNPKPRTYFIERDWQEKETATKIAKLRNGKVVAEYESR